MRTNIFKKERAYDFLTKKDKITRKQTKVLDNIVTYFNELYDDLLEQSKYQYNPYGLDLLFNKDDYYKPTEVKSTFDGSYVLYASNGDKDGLLYIFEYFQKIKLYLRDLIDFYNTKSDWKTQLSMQISFNSYTDNNVEIMHSKSDNVKTMWTVDANDAIQELLSTLLQRFQQGLETKIKGSNYIFNRVNSLEYHFHKVSLKRGSSYIPQPDWLSHKKSTINPYNHSDNLCFLYAIVIALNYHNIDNNPQRISNHTFYS